MANIQITPESLRTQAKTLLNHNADHRAVYGEMDSQVHNLVSGWTGEAQNAFIATFEGNRKSFEKFGTDIDTFAKLMVDAADQMQQADQELKATMAI
jgi:WXG100 family type VII secretion target